MEQITPLLFDLALILIVAGGVTLLFKWLKQPLVLGYIVAGMLAGPYISIVPSVHNIGNIEFWGKIGVIFLLFGLGLEFSLKKLKKVGGPGFITVFFECAMMFSMGFLVGRILGWNRSTSIFLGGMMSISSTSIIIKEFDDLKLKTQKFTQLVFGTLVVEDMVAILLLVLLPAIAISKSFDGMELVWKGVNMALFLLLWFTGGIFIIPTLYKKLSRLLTDETLIVVSLGLCLVMVIITVKAGISEALGAFVMGSILSGTAQSEKIIELTKPIKNFFGAIFFVSVGMLVDPMIIVQYWKPILLLTIMIIMAKPFSATCGLLLSGQTPKIALQSGMCLCQIGEFSFIIATLGKELGVVQPYLYPVIVSVSILTTFVTPYWIKLSGPFYNFIYDHSTRGWRTVLDRLGTGRKTLNRESDWHSLLKSYFTRLFIYTGWLVLVYTLFRTIVSPHVEKSFGFEFKIRCILFVATMLCMAPFLYGLLRRYDSMGLFKKIWFDKKFARGPLLFMTGIKYFIAIAVVSSVVSYYFVSGLGMVIIITSLVILMVFASKTLKIYYSRIENQFLTNLNSEGGRNELTMPRDLADQIHTDRFEVNQNSYVAGKTISQVHRAKNTGALVIQIVRGELVINLPDKNVQLFPSDLLWVLGTDNQLNLFKQLAEDVAPYDPAVEEAYSPVDNSSDADMELYQITLSNKSPLIGEDANISSIRNSFGVLVVGLEKKDSNTFIRPTRAQVVEADDTLWVVGTKEAVKALK